MNKTITALSAAFILAACTAGVPKPRVVPDIAAESGNWFHLVRYDESGNLMQNSLLAVERSQNGIRFVQTDALGAPLARQVLTQKGWSNDGFVMPNAAARRLFAAMLPLLAAGSSPLYPDLVRQTAGKSECYRQNGNDLWCSAREGHGWHFTFPDRTKWAVVPIEE